jgi:CubicO group peptidase (beta-lactamase class C family)
MNIKITTILFFVFSIFLSNAQEANLTMDKAELDVFVSSIYQKEKSGASVLVSQKGKIIYERHVGFADIGREKSIKRSTRFPIGSITKQFTATAILLLQEQGKLGVSDYLGDYLEGFDIGNFPIKIEHLLTHTAGLRTDNKAKDIGRRHTSGISPQEIAAALSSTDLLFNPGEKYQYSNNGYILLGLIVEKASGQTYGDFIHEHIFKPLKMKDSRVASHNEIIRKKAQGYGLNENDMLVPVSHYMSTFSAGAIVSTPRDLNRWSRGLFNYKIIGQVSLRAMLMDYHLNNGESIHQGYGWELNYVQDATSYEHSGSTPGFKANAIYLPEAEVYIIVMQNSELGSPTYPSIQIASMLKGKPYPLVEEALTIDSKTAEKHVGTYVIENVGERYIGYHEDRGIYYKAPGGKERKLYAGKDEGHLFFERGYVGLHFEGTSEMGYVQFTYKNRIRENIAIKKSQEVPEMNTAITIDESILKGYTGIYVSEQFTMTISLESAKLYAQPKGSDKLELKPKGSNAFFIEEIGAEIQFVTEEQGSYINIVLEGNVMKGVKQ